MNDSSAKSTSPAKPAKTGAAPQDALTIEAVGIDDDCTGRRWTAADPDYLARIIAIIGMGQAAHARRIITELLPSEPAIDESDLRADARRRLSVTGETEAKRKFSRYHRDGLIFEAISWAAAHQESDGKALLRDPHLSATTQGLDGLMIEVDQADSSITCATIFGDKCSENPDHTFQQKVMPTFMLYHENKRAAELLATAAALLEKLGLNGTHATQALRKNPRGHWMDYVRIDPSKPA